MCPVMAEGMKYSLQDDLKYPDDAINADVSKMEIVREFYKRKFRCGLLVKILKTSLDEEKNIRKIMVDGFSKEDESKGFMKFIEGKMIRIFIWYFMTRHTEPVLTDYRNKRAIEIIEENRTKKGLKNILLYYGSGHIPGITSLLLKNGWKLASISRLKYS